MNTKKLEPIKISFDGTAYYVNEKTNKVGCRLTFSFKGPDSVIKVLSQFADVECCEVLAEATLHPKDRFDVEKGVAVARAKAESMAYRKANNMFKRICGKLADVALSFKNFNDKTIRVIEHNNEYISKF